MSALPFSSSNLEPLICWEGDGENDVREAKEDGRSSNSPPAQLDVSKDSFILHATRSPTGDGVVSPTRSGA